MSNWKNKEKVLKAIYMEDYIPDVMGKIDPSLLADRDVIQYAVCIDGCSLEYASDELKDDKEVVMAAVKNYGYALSDASDSLKADKEVCLAAIGNSGEDVLDDISDSLKKDKEIISAIDNFEDDFDFDDSEEEREKPPGWVEPIHRYRIDTAQFGQGGEFVCGKVSLEFVKYWTPIIAEEGDDRLTKHMLAIDGYEGPLDPNSPKVVETEGDFDTPYHELDIIEHFTCANSDQGFIVTEITDEEDNHGVGKNEQRDIIGNCIYSREGAIVGSEEPEITEWISEDDLKDFIPVLLFHNIDKGDFGSWFIGTDENGFDASKLAYSQVETELGIFIERVWYDKEELKKDEDYASSSPKNTITTVGWLNIKLRDGVEKYTDQYIDENEFWSITNE